MSLIFATSYPLQILHSIVGFVSILVIHLVPFRRTRPQKLRGNQSMNRKPPMSAIKIS